VLGRPQRNRPRVDYSKNKRKAPLKASPPSTDSSGEQTPIPPVDVPTPPLTWDTPIILSGPLPESDDDEAPRTNYNNPAKSTETDLDDGELGDDEAPHPFEGRCIKPTKANYPKLARYFGSSPLDVIQKTFKVTRQLGCLGAVQGTKLYHRRKAPNPALNILRRNESVATNTVYSPVPAVDSGSVVAQFFVGRKLGFTGCKGLGPSDKQFATTLMNHIRKYGAMDLLISDRVQAQVRQRVVDILNILGIKDFQSEPHNKNQNFAE
jgi:hypothetical protein